MTASSQRELSSKPSICWRLNGTQARLEARDFQGAIDVAAPTCGLAHLKLRGQVITGWLLGVAIDAEPSDAYVRGNDLVVAYRETHTQPFSVQVSWRAADGPREGAVIVDATVSIQTRQWEAYPRVTVTSSLPGSQRVMLADSATLWRPLQLPWSYAEFSRPGDFTPDQIAEGDQSSWRFGEQFMERGVIRQLCLRGALISRTNDQAVAQRLRAELAVEQPPLTA
jgi:hypothetical protein